MKKNKQLLNDLIFFKEFYFAEHLGRGAGTLTNLPDANDVEWSIQPKTMQEEFIYQENMSVISDDA